MVTSMITLKLNIRIIEQRYALSVQNTVSSGKPQRFTLAKNVDVLSVGRKTQMVS